MSAMKPTGLMILVRNDKGKVFEADRVAVIFNRYEVSIRYEADFDHVPEGTYVEVGARFPGGSENWLAITPHEQGLFGGELKLTGKYVVG